MFMCVCDVVLQLEEGKMMERRKKIALELSDLVIYCRPVPFDEDSKGLHTLPGAQTHISATFGARDWHVPGM